MTEYVPEGRCRPCGFVDGRPVRGIGREWRSRAIRRRRPGMPRPDHKLHRGLDGRGAAPPAHTYDDEMDGGDEEGGGGAAPSLRSRREENQLGVNFREAETWAELVDRVGRDFRIAEVGGVLVPGRGGATPRSFVSHRRLSSIVPSYLLPFLHLSIPIVGRVGGWGRAPAVQGREKLVDGLPGARLTRPLGKLRAPPRVGLRWPVHKSSRPARLPLEHVFVSRVENHLPSNVRNPDVDPEMVDHLHRNVRNADVGDEMVLAPGVAP